MDQYEKSAPPTPREIPTVSPTDLENLQVQISRQQRLINDLQQDLRRVRTELREAINAFNSLRRNG